MVIFKETLYSELYEKGFSDKEIATCLNEEASKIISWRLHNNFPPNKIKTKKNNDISCLRKSLSPEKVEKMLFFLYMLDKMGKECIRAKIEPDIGAFIKAFIETNYFEEIKKIS